MRILVIASLLLLPVLSGCFGGGDDDDDGGDGDASSTSTGPAASPPVLLLLNVTIGNDTYRFTSDDLGSSRPPPTSGSTGTVTVSSSNSTSGTTTSAGNGTGNATGNATGNGTATPGGPAPLNVTFELGAARLTNVSGLTWSLATAAAAGNATGNSSAPTPSNGTTLPARVERTFDALGSHQVTYSLRLGDGSTQRLNVTLVVSNGTGVAAALQDIPFTAEGAITVGTQGDAGCGVTDTIDVATHDWDLSAVVSIQKFVVHMDLGTTNVDSDIFLLDPAGEEIGSSQDFNQPGLGTGSPTEDFEAEGPLAPGIYTFRVVGCVGLEMEYTITAIATVTT